MSFVPPFFKDLGKKASDLFKNDFDLSQEFKTKHTTAQGVAVETTVTGANAASLKATYKNKAFGKGEVNVDSAGSLKVKSTLDKLQAGLKVNLEGASKKSKLFTKVEAQYSQDFVAFSATVNGVGVSDPTANSSLTIGSDGLSVGGTVSFDKSFQLADKNVGIEFAQGDFTAAVTTSGNLSDISASLYNRVNSNYQFGVRFTDKSGADRTMELASQYELDADSSLKTKLSLPSNTLTLGVSHKLPSLNLKLNTVHTFSVGGGCFVRNLDKWGVQVSAGEC